MRRDDFEIHVRGTDDSDDDDATTKPSLRVVFDGPGAKIRRRLGGDDPLAADETDVTFRLVDGGDDEAGVLAVTNRLTGDFVLEANQPAGAVRSFVRAARAYGESVAADADEGRYRLVVETDDETVATYDKRTFLVYDAEGSLLRGESLIPSGVEL